MHSVLWRLEILVVVVVVVVTMTPMAVMARARALDRPCVVAMPLSSWLWMGGLSVVDSLSKEIDRKILSYKYCTVDYFTTNNVLYGKKDTHINIIFLCT